MWPRLACYEKLLQAICDTPREINRVINDLQGLVLNVGLARQPGSTVEAITTMAIFNAYYIKICASLLTNIVRAGQIAYHDFPERAAQDEPTQPLGPLKLLLAPTLPNIRDRRREQGAPRAPAIPPQKATQTTASRAASSTAHNRQPATGNWDEREERRMDTE